MNRQAAIGATTALPRGSRLQPIVWKRHSATFAFLCGLSMIMIPLFGAPAVLLFFGFGGLVGMVEPARTVRLVTRFWPLLLFPLLAMASATWSDAPTVTLRAGVQLMISFVLMIIVAGFLSARSIIRLVFFGAAILTLSALPNLDRALTLGVPLNSPYLGSKNQLGFASFLLATCAMAIIADAGQRRMLRFAAGAAIPFALTFLHLSQSGGGVVSFLLAVLLFPVFVSLASLRATGRLIVSGIAMTVLAIALLFREWIAASIAAFRTDVLDKNESLTGRTHLWEVANRIWEQRPGFGHGYASFWRHGNLEAEALWRWGGITGRTGFNFHNMFLETKVDLGIVGLTLMVTMMVVILVGALWRQLRFPNKPFAFFVVVTCVLYFRATVEDGLIAQFSLSTFLLLAAAVHSRTIPPTLLRLERGGVRAPKEFRQRKHLIARPRADTIGKSGPVRRRGAR